RDVDVAFDAVVWLRQVRMEIEARIEQGERHATPGEAFVSAHPQRRRQNVISAVVEDRGVGRQSLYGGFVIHGEGKCVLPEPQPYSSVGISRVLLSSESKPSARRMPRRMFSAPEALLTKW